LAVDNLAVNCQAKICLPHFTCPFKLNNCLLGKLQKRDEMKETSDGGLIMPQKMVPDFVNDSIKCHGCKDCTCGKKGEGGERNGR